MVDKDVIMRERDSKDALTPGDFIPVWRAKSLRRALAPD
jgi:hypothetical protein